MIDDPRVQTEIGSYFLRKHRGRWLAQAFISLLVIAGFDFATGHELRPSVLYLVPLLTFSWIAGGLAGILFAIVTCVTLAYIDVNGGRHIQNYALWYGEWGTVLLGYILLVIGLARLRQALEDAHFQSRKDSLTGLVNTSGFYEVVGAELELCRRYKRALSIAYIDCDNFKQVNDKFGHHIGDNLLRTISNTMQRKLRGSDLPGRLGGDEFAVMLPETNAEACRMVIEMLQQRLLHEMKESGWPVTFSIGIATFTRMPPSIEDMIRQADKLMYAVKHSSKGAIKQEVFGA